MKKNCITKFMAASVICLAFLIPVNAGRVFAATTYYNRSQKQTITKGLTYEKSTRVTDVGLMDVHVLKMDIDSPNLSISTIRSADEYGLKETTTKLVDDNGAIAGINGDFFGLSGKYSLPMGIEMIDGKLLALNEASNGEGNGNATFFIDKENNPFIAYMRSEVHFLVEGKENLKIRNVNKVFDLGNPAVLTPDFGVDTAELDKRIPGSIKIVCRNNAIEYIATEGATVNIPEDGFIVIMNGISANANGYINSIKPGQRVEFYLRPTIDISTIRNAVTGAGKILTEGKLANDGGTVASGRQPRTAVGISKDKKQIILVVLDGRSHSVGATQGDIANIMLEYGAYEAMHLDGGGSSTMAVSSADGGNSKVVNQPSDNYQRKVINALGIFNDAPVGEIKTIVVEPAAKYISKNSSVKINAYGLDEYNHKIALQPELLTYQSTEGSGAFLGEYFTALKTGAIVINVNYGQLSGDAVIYAEELAEIHPGQKEIRTYPGGQSELNFSGKSVNGRSISVDSASLTYEVTPAGFGAVENGVFTAKTGGWGWIKCSYGTVSAYIPVYATLNDSLISGFEAVQPVVGVGYPEGVVARTEYTNAEVSGGASAIELTYTFNASGETQAAYAVFEPKIAIQRKAYELKLNVFGDKSGHWLRARITDANSKEYTIDFAKNINWAGWKEVTAVIPSGVVYPVSLERVYVASVAQSAESTHTIYFDDLKGMFESGAATAMELPENTKFEDRLAYTMANEAVTGFDITFMPSLYFANGKDDKKPEGYLDVRKKAMTSLFRNSSRSIYLANEDIAEEAGKQIKYNNGIYTQELIANVQLVGLNSQSGGFMQSDVSQWAKLKNDLTDTPATAVILYTNLSPFSFKQQKEFELFHDMLEELGRQGKTIFVVSNEGIVNGVNVKDGIRYINLGRMYKNDGAVNGDFSILRFKINGNDIKYCIDKLAK